MSVPHCNQNRPIASQESHRTLEYCATLHLDTSPVKVSHSELGLGKEGELRQRYVQGSGKCTIQKSPTF